MDGMQLVLAVIAVIIGVVMAKPLLGNAEEALRLGADWFATGHYARMQDGRLLRGLDPGKRSQLGAHYTDPATIQQQASQVITKLKTAGVTSVIFSGDPVAPRDFTKEATAQEYFPEWIVAASTLVDVTAFARTYDQQQWAHAFGVTQLAARGNPEKSGAYADYG